MDRPILGPREAFTPPPRLPLTPSCVPLPPHLPPSHHPLELFEQLRPISAPREAHSLMILDTRLALRRGPRLFHLGDHEARGLLHAGETYNVGGETERRNIDLVHRLCEIVAEETGKPASAYTVLIWFVTDCPGHDQRGAIGFSKRKRNLGWLQAHGFDEGLRSTVRWRLEHRDWVETFRTGDYRRWIEANYAQRPGNPL